MRSTLLACVALALLAPPARADDAADAKAIVEKAIKARGGKFAAMTWKEKGTLTAGSEKMTLDLDCAFQPPDKVRIVIELTFHNTNHRLTMVMNGEKSWFSYGNDTEAQEVTGDQLAYQFHSMHTLWVTSLTPLVEDTSFTLSTAKGKDVNGKPTAGVKVTSGNLPAITLYFDKETGLLVKSEAMVKEQLGGKKEILEETYLSDYKEVGGRKFHTRHKMVRDGTTLYEGVVSDQKVSDKLDAKLFQKP
jgi:outer membrane lipoprotein-sorting protein